MNCHRKNIKNWFSYRRKLFLKSKKNAAIKNPKLQMKKFEEPKIILKEECKEEKNCEHIKTEESSISLKQEENFNENLIKIPVDSSEKIMQMFKLQHYYRAFSYFLCFANQIAIKNMLMSSKNQRY